SRSSRAKSSFSRSSAENVRTPGPFVFRSQDQDWLFGGIGIRGDLPLEQVGTGLFHLDVTDQRGYHRLVYSLAALFLDHLCGEFREDHRWRDYGVPVTKHQRVHAGVRESESDGILIGRGRLTASDVDRISCRAEGRNELAKRLVKVRRHLHQLESVVNAGIGEQHARTAGAGNYQHVLTGGRREPWNDKGQTQTFV